MPRPAVLREAYQAPAFLISQVALDVEIRDEHTVVRADLNIERQRPDIPLLLDARHMRLQAIAIDDRRLRAAEYEVSSDRIEIADVPQRFRLATTVVIDPESNRALEGLYRSGPMLCTQCEAHGFSRITPFPDRPDVLSRYRVRIEADRATYPVLLSNGNPVKSGDLPGGRHFAVWEDPYAKPCYLFALVAGDLTCVEDEFVTRSGRPVRIGFYVDHGNESRVDHAIASLKRAMRWDEDHYGLEYDLDRYMVVAARDFNMGAMENKGLNLFNAAYVLASPDTATDDDYEAVEAVIGHEYFHNWTGNRVTCRDWFQLSLKEGLTVLREQQFRAASRASGVARIEQVQTLRAQQFPEDAGPTAHSVRPDRYVEINNFYTPTVYEKGAEILRMIETLQGPGTFVEGVRRYLHEFDGQAATIEDFLAAQESVGQRNLDGFRTWYSQAGTPVVRVEDEWRDGYYRLRLYQQTPPTPGQPMKRPVPIPIGFALYDPNGAGVDLPPTQGLVREDLILIEDEVLELSFGPFERRPVPAFLHGFSAPVRLDYAYTPQQLALLVTAETDPFLRWESVQELMILAHAELVDGEPGAIVSVLLETLQRLAANPPEDRALLAWLMSLPALTMLAERQAQIDPEAVVAAHQRLKLEIGAALCGPFSVWAEWGSTGERGVDRRALSNVALDYLAAQGTSAALELARKRAMNSHNFTLVLGALNALNGTGSSQRALALAACRESWRDDPLRLDRWFSLEARAIDGDVAASLQILLDDPAFTWANPNRVRAVLGAFSTQNWRAFHRPESYALYARLLLRLDGTNPQVASRLSKPLLRWRRYAQPWGGGMHDALMTLSAERLSPDLGEMVTRALDGGHD
ncbi:MAG: aminopeptidase N [Pseudomonadota bacterium]|nr:aminopeptidase N [Pseudomonadota bacterium]